MCHLPWVPVGPPSIAATAALGRLLWAQIPSSASLLQPRSARELVPPMKISPTEQWSKWVNASALWGECGRVESTLFRRPSRIQPLLSRTVTLKKVHLCWRFLILSLILPPHFLTSDEWEHFLNKLPVPKCLIQALLSDEPKLRHQLVKGT